MIKRLCKSIRQYKFQTLFCSITVAIEVFVEILIPIAMARLLDFGISDSNVRLVYKYGCVLLILATGQITFGVISGRLSAVASAGFASNLRSDVFDKVQKFSFSNIDKYSIGSVVSRLTTDITNIQMAFQMIIRLAVRGVVMLLFSMIAAFTVNKEIAKVFLIVTPVLGLSLFIVSKLAYPLFDKMFKGYDNLNNILSENLHGIRVVKTFNQEEYENKKFKTMSKFIYGIGLTAERLVALWAPFMNIAIYITSISIIWIGAKSIIASGNDFTQGMTTGELMSLITYSIHILISLMMISFIFVMIVIAHSSSQRICELLDEEIDIIDKDNAIGKYKNGDIEFNNVTFMYSKDAQVPVLKNMNLKIKAGERIGILGMTGSGKTSLVNLIPRFYDVNEGRITIAGIDIRDYKIKTLRDAVGMVLQKNILFKGTIRSNLEFGKLNATDEQMYHALRTACADEFVMEKENGLDSVVEQEGANFSGGQRQRLCIARALIKQPSILILDDSTSAVDTQTDAKIRQGLNEYFKQTTVFIVAQRISSIEDCDRIIVLDNGEISAIGTHEELLKKSDIYKETFELQVQGGLE